MSLSRYFMQQTNTNKQQINKYTSKIIKPFKNIPRIYLLNVGETPKL